MKPAKAGKIMEAIMHEKKISKAALARALHIEHETNKSYGTDLIGKRLKQNKITIETVAEMLAVMDYQVAIIPQSVKLADKAGWYPVTWEEEAHE